MATNLNLNSKTNSMKLNISGKINAVEVSSPILSGNNKTVEEAFYIQVRQDLISLEDNEYFEHIASLVLMGAKNYLGPSIANNLINELGLGFEFFEED